MSLPSTLRHEADCARLCIDLARTVDMKYFHDSASLFSADAVWHHVAETYRGRQEIFEMLTALPVDVCTRHICTNIVINVIDDSNAVGCSNILLLQGPSNGRGLPTNVVNKFVADNRDRYELHEGRWLIAERKTTLIFAS